MTTFHLSAGTSTTQSPFDSDEEDNLPYPLELPRNDFLAPDFNPQTYLSTLRNRHQTLEDLRSDLRRRSQLLNQELLDLVNNNYEEFLSLGADLKGGEEKVEGVRVGLLGFEREVEGIRRVVADRAIEVGRLLEEKKGVRRDAMLGRGLLEVERRISDLEDSLGSKDAQQDAESSDLDTDEDDADNEDAGTETLPLKRLQRQTEQFLLLTRLIERLGSEHPFLLTLRPRVNDIKRTLLLNLGALLTHAKAAKANDTTLAAVRLHALLDAEDYGVQVLKAG